MDLKNCLIATHNVLEAMRSGGIRQLAFTSSSAIYGEIEKLPTPENAGPALPISLYGAGKLACEGFISAYCHLFDMQAWMFRFGNVMGARMGHGIIYDFIRKLQGNQLELEILGDGEQNKNYFLVEDCIDGMLCAIEKSTKQCDVFNLGNEDTVKVRDIAAIVADEMGLRNVKFRYTGGERGWPGDVPRVQYDLRKTRKLGWMPRHNSSESVRITTQRLLAQQTQGVVIEKA
jgi:UDP-glucose 4-epimerase